MILSGRLLLALYHLGHVFPLTLMLIMTTSTEEVHAHLCVFYSSLTDAQNRLGLPCISRWHGLQTDQLQKTNLYPTQGLMVWAF